MRARSRSCPRPPPIIEKFLGSISSRMASSMGQRRPAGGGSAMATARLRPCFRSRTCRAPHDLPCVGRLAVSASPFSLSAALGDVDPRPRQRLRRPSLSPSYRRSSTAVGQGSSERAPRGGDRAREGVALVFAWISRVIPGLDCERSCLLCSLGAPLRSPRRCAMIELVWRTILAPPIERNPAAPRLPGLPLARPLALPAPSARVTVDERRWWRAIRIIWRSCATPCQIDAGARCSPMLGRVLERSTR